MDKHGEAKDFTKFQHRIPYKYREYKRLEKGVEEGYQLALEAFRPLVKEVLTVLEYYGYDVGGFRGFGDATEV